MPGLFPLGIDPTSGSGSSPTPSTGSLLLTPHLVSVYPPVAQKSGNVRIQPSEGAGVQVACQVGAETASAAFEATGKELTNPYYCLCNIDDAPTFKLNSRVTLAITANVSKVFTVETKPDYHFADTTGAVNYAILMMEERDWSG